MVADLAVLAIPGIPILIVAQAQFRMRHPITKKDKERKKLPKAPTEISPARAVYHQAEFVALKGEISNILSSMSSYFQYAILASAGVFSWLLTNYDPSHITILRSHPAYEGDAVFLLPFVISGFFLGLSMALYLRLRDMRDYIILLEGVLGSHELGWENFFSKRPPTLGLIWGVGWLMLCASDYALGLYL